MAFYLGIDGGGTKTRCALGDDIRVLGTSVTGASNVIRVGEAKAREALHAGVRSVCEAARVMPEQITNICIGAAGAGREEVAGQIRSILGELTAAPVEVVADTVIALEAAFGSGPGVIVIAGTGSIVFGRNARGETARAGGWGYAISDEGSAQWIGRRAVWTILRALDQGLNTQLTGLVLDSWALKTLDELVQKANAVPPPEFPTLFPLVLRAANERDSLAAAILVEAGKHLAEQAAIVIARLFPKFQDRHERLPDEHVRVALTGSVFRQSAEVRQVFYNSLEKKFPGIKILSDPVEPVDGALARARRQHLAAGT